MGKTYWNGDKLQLLLNYLKQGLQIGQIAEQMNESDDSIEHAIRRYHLQKD